jgi:hypothetical protein
VGTLTVRDPLTRRPLPALVAALAFVTLCALAAAFLGQRG